MAQNDRKSVLVYGPLQWALVWHFLKLWLGYGLVVVLLFAALEIMFNGVFRPWSEHWEAIWPTASSVFLTMLILMPIFFYQTIKFSHRFVGPVMRVRSVLREVAAGEPVHQVKFRTRDYWSDMAEELNAAIAKLTESKNAEAADPESNTEELTTV